MKRGNSMKKLIATLMTAATLTFGVSATTFAATPTTATTTTTTIAYINTQVVLSSYPGIENIAKEISDKQIALQNSFNEQAKTLDEQARQDLQVKLNQELAEFENSKMEPVQKAIGKAIEKVAKANKVDSIVNSNMMVFGGKDLTDEVVKSLK